MTPFFAHFAAEEFARRRASLKDAHRQGRISAERANANAQLWLAIACAAGADLPELDELAIDCLWPRGRSRRIAAHEIADPADWRAELTRARDVAVRRALAESKDLKAQQRAWDLQALAVALGCPETTLIEQSEKEAA